MHEAKLRQQDAEILSHWWLSHTCKKMAIIKNITDTIIALLE
jgi:hypothetical protein